MDYKERITDEAAILFMKYGIRAVTMDTIAHHLGISKRTIYENFADKDELLTSVIKRMASRQKEVFRELMEGSENVIEAIFMILKRAAAHFQSANPTYMIDLKKYHYKVYESISGKSDIKNFKMSQIIFERGIKENIFRKDLNIELVNAAVHGFIDILRDHEYFPPEKFTRMEVIDTVLINYLKGISTDKGAELIDKQRSEL
ncbi:MAG: TetR/AcrR family transcriptional regulator [Bacteroidales bacterium]|nr:TetR/AcrR family transcriptional regulator [Bacteroidales bacterium]